MNIMKYYSGNELPSQKRHERTLTVFWLSERNQSLKVIYDSNYLTF